MKNIRGLLILIFLFHSSVLVGQEISQKYPELIERVSHINKDTSLIKVTLENEEFMTQMTDGGGELVGYFKNGQIQKIATRIGLSYGIKVTDYYFTNGELIFTFEILEEFLYNESLSKFDYSNTDTSFIGLYYFKGNKLIDSESTGHNRFEKDELDYETTILNSVKEYGDKLKKRQ